MNPHFAEKLEAMVGLYLNARSKPWTGRKRVCRVGIFGRCWPGAFPCAW